MPSGPDRAVMRLHLTSVANERVKRAAKLRDAKARREQERFAVDGLREIARAVQAGVAVDEVFVCPDLVTEPLPAPVAKLVEHPATVTVTPEVWQKLTYGERADGVLLVGRWTPPTLANLDLSQGGLVAILDDLEKPGNVGAILRSADAAGVTAVLLTGRPVDLTGPNVIRASTGVVFQVPTICTTVDDAVATLTRQGYRLYAARVEAATDWCDLAWREPTAVILGREDTGVSQAWKRPGVEGVRLPMLGQADSLNVSVTAAVLFYESLRHRRETRFA